MHCHRTSKTSQSSLDAVNATVIGRRNILVVSEPLDEVLPYPKALQTETKLQLVVKVEVVIAPAHWGVDLLQCNDDPSGVRRPVVELVGQIITFYEVFRSSLRASMSLNLSSCWPHSGSAIPSASAMMMNLSPWKQQWFWDRVAPLLRIGLRIAST
jgi:hypothetical protein